MVDTSGAVAIIPARGGSKSIPRKNIRPLGRYPLIVYSIAAARSATVVERVIVSTEDEEIARIARDWGAEVPFMRPAELAADHVTDLPVFMHALTWLDQHEGYRPEVLIHLRPTSPIRPVGMVDGAVALLRSRPDGDSVRAVTPSGQNPFKMWRIEGGRMTPLMPVDFPEPYNLPRQELPDTYWQTGHLDVIRRQTITGLGSMTGRVILPYLIDSQYAIDIDTLLNWRFAEFVVASSLLDIVRPARRMPDLSQIRLLVLDFDGVLTDNMVFLSETGHESVVCSREDGMAIARLRAEGIHVMVLSSEQNPVVAARCIKLGIGFRQGVEDKASALRDMASRHGVDTEHVAFVGNDINDLSALEQAGCAIAVGDAHEAVFRIADVVLTRRGGHGAIRELCDRILAAS